ncbi:MAG TPA: ABC transporter substrate-binding protein [Dehalococcoidia bacterium]|nr:ABC transporter substrate-binding protein [Dehalococcoidia bacterium]
MTDDNYWKRIKGSRISRRAFLGGSLATGAALAAAAAVGCGDDETGTTSTPRAGGEVKRGGTLSPHTTNDAPHMDLHRTNSIFHASSGAGLAYSRLFRKKIGQDGLPNRITPEGDLVERFENPEPTVFVFHLRRGVKFHNIAPVSGRELVAADVVQSFERMRAERFNAELIADVDRMTVVDNYTIRFELKGPNADFLTHLTDPRAPIMPKESWEVSGNLERGPIIGSGPWIFQEWQPNQIVRLVRNPDYFRPGLPYADGLNYFRIADPQTAQAAFRQQQIHTLFQANPQIARTLSGSVPGAVLAESRLSNIMGGNKIWTHPDRAPTDNLQFRQAISKVIDRKALIDTVEFGGGFLSAGIGVPDLSWLLRESEFEELLKVDVARAKQLAAAAGNPSWSPQFFAGVRQFPTTSANAELITAALKQININATIVLIDNVQLLNNAWGRGEWDIGFGTQQPQISPTANLEKFYKTGGSQNGYKISDPELDRMIDRQKTLVDRPDERRKLLEDIQRRVIDQAMLIPVYTTIGGVLLQPFLKNYVQDNNENSRFEVAWLDI